MEKEISFKDGVAMSIAIFQLIAPFILVVTGVMGLVTWLVF